MKTTNPNTNTRKFTQRLVDLINQNNDESLCKIALEEDTIESHFLIVDEYNRRPKVYSRVDWFDPEEDLE